MINEINKTPDLPERPDWSIFLTRDEINVGLSLSLYESLHSRRVSEFKTCYWICVLIGYCVYYVEFQSKGLELSWNILNLKNTVLDEEVQTDSV